MEGGLGRTPIKCKLQAPSLPMAATRAGCCAISCLRTDLWLILAVALPALDVAVIETQLYKALRHCTCQLQRANISETARVRRIK